MSQAAVDITAHTPSRGELLARVRALTPKIAATSMEREKLRAVEPETIEMIGETGVFRAMQPSRFGGREEDFTFMIDLAFEIGRACGSTAWVSNLYVVHQWLAATFPLEAQEELFGEDPNVTICGSYAPAGKTTHVDGGFRVSGEFQFASGCDNATWAVLGIMVPPRNDGDKPNPGFALVPAKDYAIDDNWFTAGLAATGSKNLVLDDVFVPAHRFVSFGDLMAGKTPGAMVHDNPLYRISFLGALPVCIASPSFGIAQGAHDDFVGQTKVRETRGAVKGGGFRVADFEMIQGRIAEASACIDAGELLLRRDCDEAMASARAGEQLDVATRIRNRRDQAFAVKLCVQAVDALQACTGGKGLFLENSVQRAWRDVHAISHHISLNWDAVSTMYGQHQLGLEPRGQY